MPTSPTILTEIKPEQFNSWLHHPVTELVWDYLGSMAWLIERQVVEGWIAGKQTLQSEQEARGRVIAYRLLQNLKLDEVRNHFAQMEQINAAD